MKKSLTYTLATLALVLSTGFTAVVSSFATTEQNSNKSLIATDSNLVDNNKTTNLSKSENIYIITNSDGSVNKSFVNNTINTSSEPLPINASITYSLDGNEIKGEDLVGKSGHVKITYKFTATKTYQNKLVPFLTVTSLSLDPAKFTNIHIDHGKIISESSNTLLAGYTFAGLNEDLGTDILPGSFTLTADVTNFELPNTYTFATNELFAEIDTTQLTSIDSIASSINDLGTAFDKILAGSSELTKGSTDLSLGASKLASGANNLADGASQLATGSQELSAGLNELTSHNAELNTGANTIINSTLQNLQEEGLPVTRSNYSTVINATIANLREQQGQFDPGSAPYAQIEAKIASLTQAKNLIDLGIGILGYTNGVTTAATGATELSAGASTLAAGATELSNGTNELATGASQLAAGANTLNSGLTAFKEQGLNKLINFANNNLSTFTANLRSTVNAANSYHHYSNSSATSVKFIFKTPSLK